MPLGIIHLVGTQILPRIFFLVKTYLCCGLFFARRCLLPLLRNLKNKNATHSSLFFYLVFLSQTFTIPRTRREVGDYPFNSSLPLPVVSKTVRY